MYSIEDIESKMALVFDSVKKRVNVNRLKKIKRRNRQEISAYSNEQDNQD